MSLADAANQVVHLFVPRGDDLLIDVVKRAKAEQMHVIHNGSMVMVCSVIPVGWKRLPVAGIDRKKHVADDHSSTIDGVSGDISALSVRQTASTMRA